MLIIIYILITQLFINNYASSHKPNDLKKTLNPRHNDQRENNEEYDDTQDLASILKLDITAKELYIPEPKDVKKLLDKLKWLDDTPHIEAEHFGGFFPLITLYIEYYDLDYHDALQETQQSKVVSFVNQLYENNTEIQNLLNQEFKAMHAWHTKHGSIPIDANRHLKKAAQQAYHTVSSAAERTWTALRSLMQF